MQLIPHAITTIIIMFFSVPTLFAQEAPSYKYLPLDDSSYKTENCGWPNVEIHYTHEIDKKIACEGIDQAKLLVKDLFSFETDVPIKISFRDKILLSLPPSQETGKVVWEPIYALFVGTEGAIEMSSITAELVISPQKVHFSLSNKDVKNQIGENFNQYLYDIHKSVVVHEMVHQFTQYNSRKLSGETDQPVPQGVSEYLSFIVQVESLPTYIKEMVFSRPENKKAFQMDSHINVMLYYASPHTFGTKSYNHFNSLSPQKKKSFVESILMLQFNPDSGIQINL